MKLFKKIPKSIEEKEYEIRVLYDDTGINVVAFLDNHPANGYRHQIKLPNKCNVLEVLEQNIAGKLIEMTKNDIIEKKWEKTYETIQQNIMSP